LLIYVFNVLLVKNIWAKNQPNSKRGDAFTEIGFKDWENATGYKRGMTQNVTKKLQIKQFT
jgi:hypothetical protein